LLEFCPPKVLIVVDRLKNTAFELVRSLLIMRLLAIFLR
jgi:hypothetical protein